ncbi:MAG: PP2C family serine/threonine-protein phosphatase [bacterium]|nr:PP2C family serine/threonine-protein phosphatase [bacterium]
MQIFEFHFNPYHKSASPKTGPDLIFDSFCYEPENISEKRLGGLYMAGILKNVLPQNISFLESLAKTIKERYYKTVLTGSEKNLKEALKKANEHLETISKRGDVSWLGNLGFVAMAISKSDLYFTKVGETKIYLLRGGQIIDIDHKLDFEGIEPYPLKVFGNIISGKLAKNDIILILTKEIADIFLRENLLAKIAKLSFLPYSGNIFKALKEIFSIKKEQLLKIAGVCLVISCSEKPFSKEKETLAQPKTLKTFSLKKVFSPFAAIVKKFLKPKLPKRLQQAKKIKIRFPELKFPQWPLPALKKFLFNKNAVLILSLILFLAFGFFVFQKKEEAQLRVYKAQLNQIEEKVNRAEGYLIISKTSPQAQKKANDLFKESWEEISPLSYISATLPSDFAGLVAVLQKKISENLYQLNKLETIQDITPFIEIKPREFASQKIVSFKDNLYVFNAYTKNVFEVNQNGEGKIIPLDKKIDFASAEADFLFLFSKPNELIVFQDGQFKSPFSLEPPSADFNFVDFTSYLSNLYFLEEKANEIIKYPFLRESQWSSPQSWLNPKIKIAAEFKSMATDGSIWVLTKENSVKKYYLGNLEKTLTLDIFPEPKDFTKLFTLPQLSYLYLLEPSQKRIIIIDKAGAVIKQFQSEKFDNLLDFAVSADGKTIYLLNDQKIYKINF